MHRALFALILLPLMLAIGCSSGRTSAPEPSGESTETTETTAMETAKDTSTDTSTEKAAPQGCTYTTTQLASPAQVQIDCSNGTSIVVRQRADGKWEQEARAVAGARPSYASVEQAAKALCCR